MTSHLGLQKKQCLASNSEKSSPDEDSHGSSSESNSEDDRESEELKAFKVQPSLNPAETLKAFRVLPKDKSHKDK